MSEKSVRFSVHKLVRDHVPLVTGDPRVLIQTVPLDDGAFLKALTQKLCEEAQEVQSAQRSELLEELADVREVMDEIMKLHGISQEQLLHAQEKKRKTRGGFNERLFITTIEAPKDSKVYTYCMQNPEKYPVIEPEDHT
jgi:predicted house-cleaning noncanonical NTP pyrophosphatase (MazG superfamily)